MAGLGTSLIGAILVLVDIIRLVAGATMGGRRRGGIVKVGLPVLFVLGIALIVLGLLALSGVEELSMLP